jgi:hypothetical protein
VTYKQTIYYVYINTTEMAHLKNKRRDFMRHSAILRSVDCQFITDVSGQLVIPSARVKKHKQNAEKPTQDLRTETCAIKEEDVPRSL